MATTKKRAPGLGETVFFVYGGKVVPAIVTNPAATMFVPSDDQENVERGEGVALTVFPEGAPPFTTVAAFDDDKKADATWHYGG